jgi:hypothetical protein
LNFDSYQIFFPLDAHVKTKRRRRKERGERSIKQIPKKKKKEKGCHINNGYQRSEARGEQGVEVCCLFPLSFL